MNKEEKYRLLTEQIRSLIEGEKDVVAVMANVAAAIHETMGFFWTTARNWRHSMRQTVAI